MYVAGLLAQLVVHSPSTVASTGSILGPVCQIAIIANSDRARGVGSFFPDRVYNTRAHSGFLHQYKQQIFTISTNCVVRGSMCQYNMHTHQNIFYKPKGKKRKRKERRKQSAIMNSSCQKGNLKVERSPSMVLKAFPSTSIPTTTDPSATSRL